jgi:hypothetical protein
MKRLLNIFLLILIIPYLMLELKDYDRWYKEES